MPALTNSAVHAADALRRIARCISRWVNKRQRREWSWTSFDEFIETEDEIMAASVPLAVETPSGDGREQRMPPPRNHTWRIRAKHALKALASPREMLRKAPSRLLWRHQAVCTSLVEEWPPNNWVLTPLSSVV